MHLNQQIAKILSKLEKHFVNSNEKSAIALGRLRVLPIISYHRVDTNQNKALFKKIVHF